MKDAAWRIIISVTTALLLITTYVMIWLTSPQMLVGVGDAGSVDVTITRPNMAESEGAPVNINTATHEELMTVPGIGQVLAMRIVDHREQNGPFVTVDELTAVEGIGEGRVTKWRDYLCVE